MKEARDNGVLVQSPFPLLLSGHLYSFGVEVEAKRAERGRALGKGSLRISPGLGAKALALAVLSL